jgi:TetR/AcrR family transcriptional repressor of nem operon
MPSEKSFKEADVVNQAMQIFWEKGYTATSISDITEATGIKRGSLYNAFEGKRDLFLQSLLAYDRTRLTQRLSQLDEVKDPREAISGFIKARESAGCETAGAKGCLLVNTLLEYAHHDPEVQQTVSDALGEVVSFFERKIRQGQRDGTIPDSVEVRATAQALLALIVGVRVLGRGAMADRDLRRIEEQAMRFIS